jgi:hypothetical protein
MEKMLYTPAQAFNDLLCTRHREGDHVNHDIGFEIAHALSESALRIFHSAICIHLLNGTPRAVRPIWFALGARDIDYLMTRLDQARDKVGPHVTTSANHHHAHVHSPFVRSQIRI